MLDRVTTVSATVGSPATTVLARRRALFAGLVGTTMASNYGSRHGSAAVHTGAIAFLLLFTVTLPWSVVGFGTPPSDS